MSCRTGVRQSIGRNKVGVCYKLYLCRHDKLALVDFRCGEHILHREFPSQAHNQQRMIHRCDAFCSAACQVCSFAGVWAESSGYQGLGLTRLRLVCFCGLDGAHSVARSSAATGTSCQCWSGRCSLPVALKITRESMVSSAIQAHSTTFCTLCTSIRLLAPDGKKALQRNCSATFGFG